MRTWKAAGPGQAGLATARAQEVRIIFRPKCGPRSSAARPLAGSDRAACSAKSWCASTSMPLNRGSCSRPAHSLMSTAILARLPLLSPRPRRRLLTGRRTGQARPPEVLSMRGLRPSSEVEMVALFLRTELPAARFRDDLRALLESDGVPERVVTDPNFAEI